MKRLLVILAAVIALCEGIVVSSTAGTLYELSGIMVHPLWSQVLGFPVGEITDPPMFEIVFVDGYVPAPGGNFTEADIASAAMWNQSRSSTFGTLEPEDTITGTFSTTDITNGLPEIDLWEWVRENDVPPAVATLYANDSVTIVPNPGDSVALTDAIFVAKAGAVVPDYTGIQVTGLSSNILANVTAGDTVTFTVNTVIEPGSGPVNYRFWIRKGYELIGDAANPWGGNSWQLMQNWSTMNLASISFSEPGFYFVAVHCSEDTTWSAADGDPQTGMVVEVWPAQ